MTLTELTFVEEGGPDQLPGGLNVIKLRKMWQAVIDLQDSLDFPFVTIPDVQV